MQQYMLFSLIQPYKQTYYINIELILYLVLGRAGAFGRRPPAWRCSGWAPEARWNQYVYIYIYRERQIDLSRERDYVYTYVYVYIYIYTHMYLSLSLYLYIYICLQRERDMYTLFHDTLLQRRAFQTCADMGILLCLLCVAVLATWATFETKPSPPKKSFDFRGFDSSKLLILKAGNSHVR